MERLVVGDGQYKRATISGNSRRQPFISGLQIFYICFVTPESIVNSISVSVFPSLKINSGETPKLDPLTLSHPKPDYKASN